jgi:hypothetical protein
MVDMRHVLAPFYEASVPAFQEYQKYFTLSIQWGKCGIVNKL